MDDLEICKRIAEIEGLEVACARQLSAREYNHDACVILPFGKYAGGSYGYYPLKDDALCFRLMVKYNVLRELAGDKTFRAVICNWGGGSEYYRGVGDTLNKAILLAIIKLKENI